jgi:hypothetical protein
LVLPNCSKSESVSCISVLLNDARLILIKFLFIVGAHGARYRQASDPLTFAVVASGLTAVALLATYVPVRPVVKVNPSVALARSNYPMRSSHLTELIFAGP